ncbi:PI-PLC X domain-containing protein 1 isoform X2 [Acanthochromis polyacanthus]|uniref:PI-PLC X domain-containing protein 1 isoform X2 n=1 Tax=Acanthochromis polyacanthus TaxID=80966 RepID=UPI0022340B22|nr:PI-PLC X domain-containing protein 1 isoform X2 [Acanthochromis polyacanthus]
MELSCQDWMSALPEELWDVSLTDLAIPGSHDAMSYCLDINSPLLRSESDFFRVLDGLFYCFTRPIIFKWATTQETLVSVATWLKSHPKEIVILACSHLEGMDDARHESFIYSLKKLFGSKLCPQKESVLTLRNLWASGYQVILSYDSQVAARHQELWPAIPYWWANKPTAQGVISYLEWNKQQGRPEGFFVSGLNLTADRCYIAKNRKESLRTLTYSNWDSLSKWVEEQIPGSDPKSLNIIAGDFVGPLPLCSQVIALNQKLRRRNSIQIKKQY